MLQLREVKRHLNVEHNADDELIAGLIHAAKEAFEAQTFKRLEDATFKFTARQWMLLNIGELYVNRTLTSDRRIYSFRFAERMLDAERDFAKGM
jgi:uncharacterized phiE125 gp8 family phage protein